MTSVDPLVPLRTHRPHGLEAKIFATKSYFQNSEFHLAKTQKPQAQLSSKTFEIMSFYKNVPYLRSSQFKVH